MSNQAEELITNLVNVNPGIKFTDIIKSVDGQVMDDDIIRATQSLVESSKLSYIGFTLPNSKEKGMLFPKGTTLIIRES